MLIAGVAVSGATRSASKVIDAYLESLKPAICITTTSRYPFPKESSSYIYMSDTKKGRRDSTYADCCRL
jgi:hypothetical protein